MREEMRRGVISPMTLRCALIPIQGVEEYRPVKGWCMLPVRDGRGWFMDLESALSRGRLTTASGYKTFTLDKRRKYSIVAGMVVSLGYPLLRREEGPWDP
jgi:hypothetical protein